MRAGAQHIFTLKSVQIIRKIVLLLAMAVGVVAFTVTASRWAEMSGIRYAIEWIGVFLIVVCIVGRTWSSLYIGGRKNSEIVRIGPYSVSRNPLYLFSFIGAAGIGAQFGSLTIVVVCVAIAWLVFRLVVHKEERALLARYGDTYRAYMADVPRFLPRFSGWRNVDTLTIRPRSVMMTFLDACVFLLAIPLADGIRFLQHAGYLPVLLQLP
jgi:protein-S-isoprenylcysteine O-methyltransferase Ste14